MRFNKHMALCALGVSLLAGSAWASPPANGTLGEPCGRNELAPHEGVICQATGEWIYNEPEVLNARKGDLLLNSACGPTAGLVSTAVAQKFSHVGIMIEDRRRIRHARVKLEPFMDSIDENGGSGTLLKFGWPGVISQTVQAAFEGSELRPKPLAAPFWTPDQLQVDSHFGFERNHSDCEALALIDPLVMKPPMEFEDAVFPEDATTVRERLFRVADEAINLTGHYRFFAFTEVDIHGRTSGRGADAPTDGNVTLWEDESGERHHPKGMQCAAFIWHAAQAAGFEVDDGLPHPVLADPAMGGRFFDGHELEHGPASLRGLYVYPEENRRQGIAFLGSVTHRKASELINTMPYSAWVAANLLEVPYRLSLQMRSCFAFDECEDFPVIFNPFSPPETRPARLLAGEVGEGLIVSPGDMTHWDPYPNGLWGSTEPLDYEPGTYREIYRWAASSGSGNLEVTALRGDGTGVKVPGVTLQLPASVVTPTSKETDEEGFAEFVAVAASSGGSGHTLIVSYEDSWNETPPLQKEKLRSVIISPGMVKAITLHLDGEASATDGTECPPNGLRVKLGGKVDIRDDDVGPDDTGSFEPAQFLFLGDGTGERIEPPEPFSEGTLSLAEPVKVLFFGDLPPAEDGSTYAQACVDEVMTGGQLSLEYIEDHSHGRPAVLASLSARLYEGTSSNGCGYDGLSLDLDDAGDTEIFAIMGEGAVPLSLSLLNSRRRSDEADRYGGDRVTFRLTVEAAACFTPGGSTP